MEPSSGADRGSAQRRRGFTVLEVVVSSTTMAVIMGVLASAFLTLTAATEDLQSSQFAEQQLERARIALTNSLQLTDTVGKTIEGEPFFEVLSVDRGTDNAVRFRGVTKYEAGNFGVEPVFSTSILIKVDGNGNLTMEQDGETRVVSVYARSVKFELTETGVILVELKTYADRKDESQDRETRFAVTPRNRMQMILK